MYRCGRGGSASVVGTLPGGSRCLCRTSWRTAAHNRPTVFAAPPDPRRTRS